MSETDRLDQVVHANLESMRVLCDAIGKLSARISRLELLLIWTDAGERTSDLAKSLTELRDELIKDLEGSGSECSETERDALSGALSVLRSLTFETGEKKKTLNITNIEEAKQKIPDLEVYGDGDAWVLLCKASSKSQGWMKSTKVMNVPGGCLVQVSTQQGDHVAEAVTFVPGVRAHVAAGISPHLGPI